MCYRQPKQEIKTQVERNKKKATGKNKKNQNNKGEYKKGLGKVKGSIMLVVLRSNFREPN